MNNIVTTFEDLAPEIYLCIFDYLNIYFLYKAFADLNCKFTSLLNDKHLLLTFNTRHNPKDLKVPQYAISNVRSLISTVNNLLLPNYFHDQLEQITFIGQKITLLSFEKIFQKLNTLTKLSSITLKIVENNFYDQVCNMILFKNYLPSLKRFTCNTMKHIFQNNNIWTGNQIVSLTGLCTVIDLHWIFFYSPQLININISILDAPSIDLSEFNIKALRVKRAKLHITFHTGYYDLQQILIAIPNLKYLELVGNIPSFVINGGRNFRQLFSKELKQVKLDLQVTNLPYTINLIQRHIFDLDCYWHNVKWTKTPIDFHQVIQLTALGYED